MFASFFRGVNQFISSLQVPAAPRNAREGMNLPVSNIVTAQGQQNHSTPLCAGSPAARDSVEEKKVADYADALFRPAQAEERASPRGPAIDDSVDRWGRTALHRAALNADEVEFGEILRTTSFPLARDAKGRTALHLAVEVGFHVGIKLILSRAPHELHVRCHQGETPLHSAVQKLVSQLPNNNSWYSEDNFKENMHVLADPEGKRRFVLSNRGMTNKIEKYQRTINLLLDYCPVGSEELAQEVAYMQRLFDQQFAPRVERENPFSRNVDSELHLAMQQLQDESYEESLQYDKRYPNTRLLRNVEQALSNANVNYQNNKGETALHQSIYPYRMENREAVCELLLNAGADPSIKDQEGMTVLHKMMKKDGGLRNLADLESESIKAILDHPFFDINAQDNDGNTVLHLLLKRESVHKKTLALFLARGANINLPNNKNETAVLLIIRNGVEFETITEILNRPDANVNISDCFGRTPLHHCASLNPRMNTLYLPDFVAVAQLLIARGADIKSRGSFGLPLHCALGERGHGSVQMVELLLTDEEEQELEARDGNGRSAFHLAALKENIEEFEIVMRVARFPLAKDDDGKTALHLAAAKGFFEGVKRIVAAHPEELNRRCGAGKTVFQHAIDGLVSSENRNTNSRLEPLKKIIFMLRDSVQGKRYEVGPAGREPFGPDRHRLVMNQLFDAKVDVKSGIDYCMKLAKETLYVKDWELNQFLLEVNRAEVPLFQTRALGSRAFI